jgi:hypothetical protein
MTTPTFLITVYANGLAFGLSPSRFPPSFYPDWPSLLAGQPIDRLLIPLVIRADVDAIYLPR